MKALFKLTVLASSAALLFSSLTAQAGNSDLTSLEDRAAYALGVSFEKNMENYFAEQKDLGIQFKKEQLAAGVLDGANNKSKLTDAEIEEAIKEFQAKLQEKSIQRAEKTSKAGDDYRADFAKKPGVNKTKSGLLYKIENPGKGEAIKESDVVVVNYRGSLIDGTEFDSSYKRGAPAVFPLEAVIQGWTEGLQLVKKGGKITLVIPPELAYGDNVSDKIPAKSTLVFEVEVVNVNPKNEEAAPAAPAESK